MTEQTTLMQFPCDFPIKIIGHATPSFLMEITHIIKQHYPATLDNAITHKPSQNGKYLSITATVHAQNQAELDALYQALTRHPDIKMVL